MNISPLLPSDSWQKSLFGEGGDLFKGAVAMDIQEKDIARFWNMVDIKPDDECWKWSGYTMSGGYGRFQLNKYPEYTHRVSWEIANGKEIPDGMQVCHHCDNPSCVNPGHLFLGTQSDNIQDCASKGRLADRHGERSGQSILTKDIVIRIRKQYKSIEWGAIRDFIEETANRYNVSVSTIKHIVYNNRWKHLP